MCCSVQCANSPFAAAAAFWVPADVVRPNYLFTLITCSPGIHYTVVRKVSTRHVYLTSCTCQNGARCIGLSDTVDK
ncbi:unnamed protein product [Acanthoscelides obtectus]|uniref:Uncharacterized protein n=1 Tax=Acanthoscelides obtectus TaxID=200917 RepID=A0A9P0PAS8_ACAOB|nr:unnamed protein product [Acanthoscelides obtectus]CAK1633417.1 hypothetical protein AOBTE_LOCUS8117 [Acanthoscelides obtectus]